MIEKIRYLIDRYDKQVLNLHSLRMCAVDIKTSTAGYSAGIKELTDNLKVSITETFLEE